MLDYMSLQYISHLCTVHLWADPGFFVGVAELQSLLQFGPMGSIWPQKSPSAGQIDSQVAEA